MAREFKVSNWYDVDLEKVSNNCRIDTGTRKKTKYYRTIKPWSSSDWEKNGCLGNKRGVYIYTWKGMPIYVGKTMNKNGFSAECFHTHKIGNHSQKEEGILTNFLRIVDRKRVAPGTMRLQFIYWDGKVFSDEKKNRSLSRDISALEKYLIRKALKVSGEFLMNTKDTRPHWSVPGFDGEDFSENQEKTNVKLLNKCFEKKH